MHVMSAAPCWVPFEHQKRRSLAAAVTGGLNLSMLTVIGLFGLLPANVDCQQSERNVATLELEATFPEPFSYLMSVRELRDGTLLAADPLGQVLLRVNFDAGTADTVGRDGSGPQEYQGPDQVLPLPGDSTLLVDLGNGRLIVMDGEGTFVDWPPMLTPTDDGWGRTVHPRFTDSTGFLYATGLYHKRDPPDSTAIYRIDRSTGEEEIVAWAWRTAFHGASPVDNFPILEPRDDWAVGANGRIALVRANGYSVEWFLSDGNVRRGAPVEANEFRVGPADMEAAIEEYARDEIQFSFGMGDRGIEAIRMRRGFRSDVIPSRERFDWPRTLPTFRVGRTIVSPRGEAWVERHMPSNDPGRVDVFDQQGTCLGFIEIPHGSRVIGFGAAPDTQEFAYVTNADEFGLVWLSRYRIVRSQ